MSSKFSIIVPVYNAANTLRSCLGSIVNQDYAGYEVILIDDGSSDESGSLCAEFSKRFAQVRVASQTNLGPGAARNAGLALARGDYVVFVDADDYIEPTMLRQLAIALNVHPVDVLFFGMVVEAFGMSSAHYPGDRIVVFNKGDIATGVSILIESEVFGFQGTKAVRTAVLRENGIHQRSALRMGEDMVFTMDIVRVAESVGIVPIAPYHYVRRVGSLTLSSASGDIEAQSLVTEIYVRFLDDMGVANASRFKVQRAARALRSVVAFGESRELQLSESQKLALYHALWNGPIMEVLRLNRRSIRGAVQGRAAIPIRLCAGASCSLSLYAFGKLTALAGKGAINGA